jgi:hypothetical protein
LRSIKKKGRLTVPPVPPARGRRIGKGTTTIYDARVKDVGGDDILEVLHEPYTPVAGLHFGFKD